VSSAAIASSTITRLVDAPLRNTKRALHDLGNRDVEVGVEQHDGGILAAELELRRRQMARRGKPDRFADRSRARERNRLDSPIADERGSDLPPPPVTQLITPGGNRSWPRSP
jgi:hypothetical protein